MTTRMLSPSFGRRFYLGFVNCGGHEGVSQSRRTSSFSSTSIQLGWKKYIPRRAVMYVPGNDDRKIAKIPTLGADCVVLDCEDGVAVNKKAEARTNIRSLLDSKSLSTISSEITVRVNSMQSGICTQDLECILPTENLPSAIHLPKVDSVSELVSFFDTSSTILKSSGRNNKDTDKINLIIFIESAKAMLSLPQICQAAWDHVDTGFFIPDALVFGSDDYCADIGAIRSKQASELLYARQYLVMVAKAFKLQAIDIVFIDYKDTDGLRLQALEGAQMGYTGKQIIHPGQVLPCQEAFTPSPEKIQWARDLIAEFTKHSSGGKGAFDFRGNMIDMPLVLQAKHILQLANKISK